MLQEVPRYYGRNIIATQKEELRKIAVWKEKITEKILSLGDLELISQFQSKIEKMDILELKQYKNLFILANKLSISDIDLIHLLKSDNLIAGIAKLEVEYEEYKIQQEMEKEIIWGIRWSCKERVCQALSVRY